MRAEDSPRGALTRQELLDGAATLLGAWFPAAYADPARRGWGIAFPTPQEAEAHDPTRRLALARVRQPTPEQAPLEEQVWHTYPPVEVPSTAAVVDALTRPETWPDYASEIGRFTPLRLGGLLGQTFEIEVAAGTDCDRPLFTRGYVTVTELVTPADPAGLKGWVDAVQDGLGRYGDGEPPALPYGAEPVVGLDLTTHAGHFMGAGHNRLLLFEHDGRSWVRAIGTWTPCRGTSNRPTAWRGGRRRGRPGGRAARRRGARRGRRLLRAALPRGRARSAVRLRPARRAHRLRRGGRAGAAAFVASAATAVATARSIEGERLRAALESAEAERRRWARELRDETLQALGGLQVLLSGAARADDPERLRTAVEQVAGEVENLRAIITELRPASLDALGLVRARASRPPRR